MKEFCHNRKHIAHKGAIAGIISSVFYFSAIFLNFLPNKILILLGISFPLLMIVGFIGIYHYLKEKSLSLTLETAYLFGLLAGLIACTFIVIQQANMAWNQKILMVEGIISAHDSKSIFRSVNRVQLAMDIVFDILISTSIFLLGLYIIKTKKLNPSFGWTGCFLAFLLLLLNLYTFPDPPTSKNTLDAGPFIGMWMLVLLILVYKKTKPK